MGIETERVWWDAPCRTAPSEKPYGAGLPKQPGPPIAPCPFQSLHLFLLA